MKIIIEYDVIVTRRTEVNCTDLQVARELFESGPDHIIEGWEAESRSIDSRLDRDSGSFWPADDPPTWVTP